MRHFQQQLGPSFVTDRDIFLVEVLFCDLPRHLCYDLIGCWIVPWSRPWTF